MITRLRIVVLLLISLPSFAETYDCKLPKNETLTIGCSNYCGRFNKWALRKYARRLGYKLKIVNLRSSNQSIDYSQVDGILIPGGSDINPERYINAVTPEMRDHIEEIKHLTNYSEIGELRDEFEFDLLENYFQDERSLKQPILGICRGMQVLTVSQGIPLYIDIKHELGIKNRRYTLDLVSVKDENSLIKSLMKKSKFRGVELHHQGLHVPYFLKHIENWPHLNLTATSNGGKIGEVLEFSNRPVLGVQFHPEYTFGKVRQNLFKWLLNKACENKTQL